MSRPASSRTAVASIVLLVMVLITGCSDAHTEADKQWADDGIDPTRTTLLVPASISVAVARLVEEFTSAYPKDRIIVAVRDAEADFDDVADTGVPTIWLDMVGNLDRTGEGRETVALGHTPLVQIYKRDTGTPPPLDLFAEEPGDTGRCGEPDPCAAPGRALLPRLGADPDAGGMVASGAAITTAVADGEIVTAVVDAMNANGRYLRVARADIPDASDLAMPVAARSFGPPSSTNLLEWLGEAPEAAAILVSMGIVRDLDGAATG